MHYRPVRSEEDLKTLESLSWEILHEHYDEYMDPDHVEFYLNKFQTVAALKEQMLNNHQHYLLQLGKAFVGFITIQVMEQSLRLSKLYIQKRARDRGLGEDAMDFIEDQAEDHAKKVIDLIVNRKNDSGIRFYKRMGFEITEELVHTFENGHSEEDYLMRKQLL